MASWILGEKKSNFKFDFFYGKNTIMADPDVKTEQEAEPVNDPLKCPVCMNIFLFPVTLLCQHTFCRNCIQRPEVRCCPTCRLTMFISPNVNAVIEDLVIARMGVDKYKQRQTDIVTQAQTEVETQQLIRRLRQQMFQEINDQVHWNRGSHNDIIMPIEPEQPMENLPVPAFTHANMDVYRRHREPNWLNTVVRNLKITTAESPMLLLGMFILTALTGKLMTMNHNYVVMKK